VIGRERFSRERAGTSYNIELLPYTMREFVDELATGASVYLKFLPVLQTHPELLEHLDRAAMSRWIGPRADRCALDNEFYMGGAGTVTNLHAERSEIFHACFRGKKRWRLYPPSETPLLYPIPARTLFVASEVDFVNPDFTVHPWFRHASGLEAVLEPGDVLYVPSYYWHGVENLAPTISANQLFYDPRRAARMLPQHWLNGVLLTGGGRGTIASFIEMFNNRILPGLHS
jgi:hypothetical protein